MRTWATLLIAVFLVSGTELRQILRLPAFVDHFSDHRSEDSDMSLAYFLWMHYCMEQVHDHDFHEDEKLPFRSHDNLPSLTVVLDELPTSSGVDMPGPLAKEPVFPEADPGLLAGERASVWQPPKRA